MTYGFVHLFGIIFILFFICCSLKDASISMLEKYGSQLIRIIKFRDSFVMIGQKGLARGKAIEMVQFIEKNSISIFFIFLAPTESQS